jgi:hypothetical protein
MHKHKKLIPTVALLHRNQNHTVYINIRKPETCLARRRNIYETKLTQEKHISEKIYTDNTWFACPSVYRLPSLQSQTDFRSRKYAQRILKLRNTVFTSAL